MTQEENRLSRAHTAIQQILKKAKTGTADQTRQQPIIDVALEHAQHWASITPPDNRPERGGSSSPPAQDEAAEQRRVHELAVNAIDRIPELTRLMETHAIELYQLVLRLSETIDVKKLPKNQDVPGCKSCARVSEVHGVKIGGHFAPIYEKATSSSLCRWCYDHKEATTSWPPVKAIDILHRQGARAASRWLATNAAKNR